MMHFHNVKLAKVVKKISRLIIAVGLTSRETMRYRR